MSRSRGQNRPYGRTPMSTRDQNTQDHNDKNGAAPALSRRSFLSKGAAAGVGAAALTGATTTEAKAEIKWDYSADVVIIGAGVAGLAAALAARGRRAAG